MVPPHTGDGYVACVDTTVSFRSPFRRGRPDAKNVWRRISLGSLALDLNQHASAPLGVWLAFYMEAPMLSQNAWDMVFFNPLALFLLVIGLVLFFSVVLAPLPWQPRKRTRIGSEEEYDPLSDDTAHKGSNI